MTNKNLNRAKRVKNDEFYTRIEDIALEVSNYKDYFRGKSVLCNCNDVGSAFWQYFHNNFHELGLKNLIAVSYGTNATKVEYNSSEIKLLGNGDFRSKECIELLNEADIVVTNPPFSLFREYIDILMAYKKKFLIVGNLNAIKYSNVFPLLMENKICLGYNNINKFTQADGSIKKFGNIVWYTNLPRSYERLQLDKTFNKEDYPKYDNYNAIEVSKTANIPIDYSGIMGVPISYMTKHNPQQFIIVGIFNHGTDHEFDLAKPILNDRELFPRIAVKSRK